MRIDNFTQLGVLRVYKTEDEKTKSSKKWIYLAEVLSYEEGADEQFDWDLPLTYIVTTSECFHISGKVEDFHKEMLKFIKGVREVNDQEIERKINDALDNLGIEKEE